MAGVAIVGDVTSVSGFRPLGLSVFPVSTPGVARDLWTQLLSGGYAVVLVTEPVYRELEDLIGGVADQAMPAFTVIPGVGSAGGVGEAKLKRAIERALGTELPVREEDE